MKTVKKRIRQLAEERRDLCDEIKKMIIDQLSLEVTPEFITNDQPIFGRGLELDSIDALDISVGLYDAFEVAVNDDNTAIYSSINTIADYVQTVKDAQARDPELRKQMREAWNNMGRERGEGPPDEYYEHLDEYDHDELMKMRGGGDFSDIVDADYESFEDIMSEDEFDEDEN
ncbi:MAG: phosphopantetheine-binding protein [Clostridiales bacterium]|jgi:acyl carrier protein|nr:phosphopantetheine-binding protein [Clostridiales bacterium]